MRAYTKRNFDLGEIRRFVEPGPIVLVELRLEGGQQYHDDGLAHDDELSPAPDGSIWPENHSYETIPAEQSALINIPTVAWPTSWSESGTPRDATSTSSRSSGSRRSPPPRSERR